MRRASRLGGIVGLGLVLLLGACGNEKPNTATSETPSPSPSEFTCEDNMKRAGLSQKRIAAICGGTVEKADTSDDDEAVTAEDGGIGGGPGACNPVPRDLVAAIQTGIDPGFKLGTVAAVKSKDYVKVWFVSGSLKGHGVKGVTGTWMTTSLRGIGPIFATGQVAVDFSDWGDAGKSDIHASTLDHGYFESQECV